MRLVIALLQPSSHECSPIRPAGREAVQNRESFDMFGLSCKGLEVLARMPNFVNRSMHAAWRL
jgi:hypothetical protein